MNQNEAVEILNKNFDDWLKSHLQTLQFLISQLHELFNAIITISVGVVGIVIPLLLTTKVLPHKNLLLTSAGLFVLEILVGIVLRFCLLTKARKKWPLELNEMYKNYRKSVKEIRETTGGFREIIEKNFESRAPNAYSLNLFELAFVSLFTVAILIFLLSIYPNFF